MDKLKPCQNCKEISNTCACIRNKCIRCGNPVGNITFTVCDDCWDKKRTEGMVKMDSRDKLIFELKEACALEDGGGNKAGYFLYPDTIADFILKREEEALRPLVEAKKLHEKIKCFASSGAFKFVEIGEKIDETLKNFGVE